MNTIMNDIFNVETDFIYKAFVSDGKTGHLSKVCNMYTNILCRHSYVDILAHI